MCKLNYLLTFILFHCFFYFRDYNTMLSFFPFLPPSISFYITFFPWSLSYSWTLFSFLFYVCSSCIKTRKTKVKLTLTISFTSNISFLDMILIIKSMIHEDNINVTPVSSKAYVLSLICPYFFFKDLPSP